MTTQCSLPAISYYTTHKISDGPLETITIKIHMYNDSENTGAPIYKTDGESCRTKLSVREKKPRKVADMTVLVPMNTKTAREIVLT